MMSKPGAPHTTKYLTKSVIKGLYTYMVSNIGQKRLLKLETFQQSCCRYNLPVKWEGLLDAANRLPVDVTER